MEFSVLLAILLLTAAVVVATQLYHLYTVNKAWGYGEIVVRWVSPEQKRIALYAAAALGALLIAILIQSEELLSALSALLIGFGGMLTQFIFFNVIGKEGVYLGRSKTGLSWDEIESMTIIQDGSDYKLDLVSVLERKQPSASSFLQRVQRELESLEDIDAPETHAEVKTGNKEGGEMRIQVEDRLAKELKANEKREALIEEEKKKEKEKPSVKRSTHTVRFTEKHQFHIQQALMYYYPRGLRYRAPEQ
jgi:hypothetical protein